MEIPEKTTAARPRRHKGFRFALGGLLAGFLGLGIAAYRMSIESEAPPPPKTKEISDVLSDTIKKTAEKFFPKSGKPAVPSSAPVVEAWPMSKRLGLAASICGFFGAAFGCVSWLVGEHRRWTVAALCVGVAALAWTHVVVAVAIAAGIAIFLWLLSTLG